MLVPESSFKQILIDPEQVKEAFKYINSLDNSSCTLKLEASSKELKFIFSHDHNYKNSAQWSEELDKLLRTLSWTGVPYADDGYDDEIGYQLELNYRNLSCRYISIKPTYWICSK